MWRGGGGGGGVRGGGGGPPGRWAPASHRCVACALVAYLTGGRAALLICSWGRGAEDVPSVLNVAGGGGGRGGPGGGRGAAGEVGTRVPPVCGVRSGCLPHRRPGRLTDLFLGTWC